MPRSRNVKHGFFINEYLGTCDPFEQLLFEGLWLLADRVGRLENRPLKIKAQIFPYRDFSTPVITGWLQNLHDNGFIYLYEVEDKSYIEILNFEKHQSPHKNEKSEGHPDPVKKPEKTEYSTKPSNYSNNPVFHASAQYDC